MGRTENFFSAVSDAATDTPLEVTRTEEGFDVTTNIVDATWIAVLYKQGLRKVFTHHVMVDEGAGTYAITDDEYDVQWKAGVKSQGGTPTPVLQRSAERTLGTVKKFEMRKTYAVDESGEFGKVVDYRFNSEDGRRVIRSQAETQGLSEKRGTITRIGIVFTVLGLLIALAAVIFAVLVSR